MRKKEPNWEKSGTLLNGANIKRFANEKKKRGTGWNEINFFVVVGRLLFIKNHDPYFVVNFTECLPSVLCFASSFRRIFNSIWFLLRTIHLISAARLPQFFTKRMRCQSQQYVLPFVTECSDWLTGVNRRKIKGKHLRAGKSSRSCWKLCFKANSTSSSSNRRRSKRNPSINSYFFFFYLQ